MMFRILIRDGTKFYCRCQKFHPMISWKVCTKWRIRESDQLKTELELFDMEIHQKISMPKYQKLKTMVKRIIDQKLRLRNFDARHWRIETGAVVTSRRGLKGVEKRHGVCYPWKTKGQCSKGDSFWHDSDERAKSTPKTTPSSEPPTQRGRSASRKRILRGRSPSGKFNRQPCKDFLKGICAKWLCDNWHPPESQNRVVHSAISGRFRTGRVRNNQIKRRKRVGDKNAVAILKDVRQLGCVFQDTAPLEPSSILRKGTKILGPIRPVRFTKATQRHADIREN